MRIIAAIFIFTIASCQSNSNSVSEQIDELPQDLDVDRESSAESTDHDIFYEPYPWDTLSSNGYHLSYRVDTISEHPMQYLVLMNHNQPIKILGGMSYGLLHKNLGYIIADFEDIFILGSSFSFGSMANMEIIEKKTGQVLNRGFYVDSSEEERWTLFTNMDVMDENDTLFLMNMNSRYIEIFDVPEMFLGNSEAAMDIDSVKVDHFGIIIYGYSDSVHYSRV